LEGHLHRADFAALFFLARSTSIHDDLLVISSRGAFRGWDSILMLRGLGVWLGESPHKHEVSEGQVGVDPLEEVDEEDCIEEVERHLVVEVELDGGGGYLIDVVGHHIIDQLGNPLHEASHDEEHNRVIEHIPRLLNPEEV
jgi:hypothetical protein